MLAYLTLYERLVAAIAIPLSIAIWFGCMYLNSPVGRDHLRRQLRHWRAYLPLARVARRRRRS